MIDKTEKLKQDLDNEIRLTYKVKILYDNQISKEKAWSIIMEQYPGYNKSTFENSWRALEKSGGKTPILNNV